MRALLPLTRSQLLSASGLALATALVAAGPAIRAQSFQATPTATFGSVTIDTGPTTTAITVSGPSAVINWTPTDSAPTGGPIIFQTSGTTATFSNGVSGPADFAVLNRIIPTGSNRPIQFNGEVISQIQSAVAGPRPGGTVFFYSPGGILIGSSAIFNVGNLVLTTSDLGFDAAGNFDTNGSYVFQPATVPGSRISVANGAQITASQDGSYLALVAPNIENNGRIEVNGSAALVAADAATMTFSPSGLFDIEVTSGSSSSGLAILNTGTITGAAASGINVHRIYMVAVPKNDALTMAIGAGSSLGFDIAGAADVDGNAIVLSAGRDVIGGNVQFGASPGGGTGSANIIGSDSFISSALEAQATGGIQFGAQTPDGLIFASDVFLRSTGGSSILFAQGTGFVNVAGNLQLRGDVFGTNAANPAVAVGADLLALDGGTITIAGSALLSASAVGGFTLQPDTSGGDGIGGLARIEAFNGSSITIGGDAILQAFGEGGGSQVGDAGGGSGFGGIARVTAGGPQASLISIGGSLETDTSGYGAAGTGCVSCLTDGGSGIGGQTRIEANSASTITIDNTMRLKSRGDGAGGRTGPGGEGRGGAANMLATSGANLRLGPVVVDVSAVGGTSETLGGNATGGQVNISSTGADGGGIRMFEAINIFANATAGVGDEPGGIGGAAEGGQVLISVQDTTRFDMRGSLRANADAFTTFGYGGVGEAVGGRVTVETRNGGELDVFQNLELAADARGGIAFGGLTAGNARGGSTEVLAQGGTITVQSGSLLSANGTGGDQFEGGNGGAGRGGLARVATGIGGSIAFANALTVQANGTGGVGLGGPGGAGGLGLGGEARVALAGGEMTASASLEVLANGFGGRGFASGGTGEGGRTLVDIAGANLLASGITTFAAVGVGGETGFSIPTGTAGQGKGGTVSLSADLSSVVLGALAGVTFDASGVAGTGLAPGNAQGGVVSIRADAATITTPGEMRVLAEGAGSGGGFGQGDGGIGAGGSIFLTASGDARAESVIDAAGMLLSANGFGGNGASNGFGSVAAGNGGTGLGGLVRLNTAPDGGSIRTDGLEVSAKGFGGAGGLGDTGPVAGESGGNGGGAQGGQIIFGAVRGNGTAAGGHRFGSVLADAGAIGGAGGDGGPGQSFGVPGSGGSASGGTIDLQLDAGSSTMAVETALRLEANGLGGSAGLCEETCAAAGGSALGGTILLGSAGQTAGNTIDAQSTTLSARGQGGNSAGADGGAGRGGSITAQLGNGISLDAGTLVLDATGLGGIDPVGFAGGAGQGGNAQIIAASGSQIGIDGATTILADGEGGASAVQGGAGTGGTARLFSGGGTIALGGNALIRANGTGGSADVDSLGSAGGAGTGGTALLTVGTPTVDGNNGILTVSGSAQLLAQGTGGAGNSGGTGAGGFVGSSARQGTLDLASLEASAAGFGGAAGAGGPGGEGRGGEIQIYAISSVNGAALVQIGALIADAGATGGSGGVQPNQGDPTDPGGSGGNALGGSVEIFGTAGNGRMTVGTVAANALATGGNGGDALDGNGGTGGIGRGGTIQMGLASGVDTGTLNTGSASYGQIEALASATGGNGGAGNAASGLGGNGGAAFGGGSLLLVRGAPVTIAAASTFAADAQGGNGGAGSAIGNGGDATVSTLPALSQISGAKLVVTNRFNQPAQTGRLDANDLLFRASANAGTGAVSGVTGIAQGALALLVSNSTFNGTNLTMVAEAGSVAPGASVDTIAMTNGTATLSGNLSVSSPNSLSLTLDQSALTARNVEITAGNWVLADPAPATLGTLRGTDSLTLLSGGDLAGHANLQSGGNLELVANGLIQFGSLSSPGRILVRAGGRATLDDVTAGDLIDISAAGPVVARNLDAVSSVSVSSDGNITLGRVTAGQSPTSLPAAGTIFLSAGSSAQTGDLAASSDVAVLAQQNLLTGQITGADTLLLAGNSITASRMGATGRVLMANRSMVPPPNPALPNNGFDKDQIFAAAPVATSGAVAVAQPSSASLLRVYAGTTATLEAFDAAQGIGVVSGGNGTFGALSSANGNIELFSRAGGITLAGANAGLNVLASGSGALDLGTIAAQEVALLSGGNVRVAGVTAGAVFNASSGALVNATGRLLVGNASMLGAGIMPGSVNYGTLLAATPVATAGTITITDSAAARRIATASVGAMSGGLLTAFERIDVATAATATVARRWTAPALRIVSADIAITDNGASAQGPSGIRTADGGSVELISSATGPVLLGDGLSGSGYALSNGEFGLISAGRLTIAAPDNAANAIDMQVGRLDVTAGGAAGTSNLAGASGTLILATGNAATQTAGGSIRVTGAINGTGFGAGNILEFSTGRFELDAASGLISLASTGTTLGGIVEINAANIHVAAPDILTRLAADPLYAGRIADLNAPAAVQRPEGVLRALGLDLYPTGTLYIQNTGTALNPAGFFADIAFSDVTLPANATPGSLSVIINGAFQTPTGIVEGLAAHDLILDTAADLSQLAADSQINGCLFSVPVCRVEGDGPDVIGAISGQFQINNLGTLGDTPPMTGDPDGLLDEEDEQALVQVAEGDAAASAPIAPPMPLVNSGPLDAQAPIEQPVAGSGNPALIGSASGGRGNEGDGR